MGPAIPGLDITVSRVESLPPSAPVSTPDGAFIKWFEHLEGTADVCVTTADGRPAVVRNGSTYYQAGWPDQAQLVALLKTLCAAAEIDTTDMPEGVRQRHAGSRRFVFNYNSETTAYGDLTLAPAAVHWD